MYFRPFPTALAFEPIDIKIEGRKDDLTRVSEIKVTLYQRWYAGIITYKSN